MTGAAVSVTWANPDFSRNDHCSDLKRSMRVVFEIQILFFLQLQSIQLILEQANKMYLEEELDLFHLQHHLEQEG